MSMASHTALGEWAFCLLLGRRPDPTRVFMNHWMRPDYLEESGLHCRGPKGGLAMKSGSSYRLLWKYEDGVTSVEYALLLTLLVV